MADNELAYGFVQLRHLANDRINSPNVGENTIINAIAESARMHTEALNRMMGGLAAVTTEYKIRHWLDGSGTLQPLSPSGDPIPVREGGYFDVAFPLQGGGTAWGTDRVSRAKMTVAEANRITLNHLRRDADWNIRHMLAALLYDGTWTFTDEQYGDLTIQALLRGDVELPIIGGSKASPDHYLAQANSIDDSNSPFGTIYSTLKQIPSNTGDVVCYVASNQTDDIEALTAFVPVGDPDILPGNASDTVRTERLEAIRGFGDEVLGKVDKCWIVEWKRLPDNYILAVDTGAPAPLARREHPEAELRGFISEPGPVAGNLKQMNMIRFAGYGARNRAGALAYYIGNAAYQNPAAYTPPLAV